MFENKYKMYTFLEKYNVQILSHEKKFYFSKIKPKIFIQNSLSSDGFTSTVYKCSREKYF